MQRIDKWVKDKILFIMSIYIMKKGNTKMSLVQSFKSLKSKPLLPYH